MMMMSLEFVDVVLTTKKQPKTKNITMSSLKLAITFVTKYDIMISLELITTMFVSKKTKQN